MKWNENWKWPKRCCAVLIEKWLLSCTCRTIEAHRKAHSLSHRAANQCFCLKLLFMLGNFIFQSPDAHTNCQNIIACEISGRKVVNLIFHYFLWRSEFFGLFGHFGSSLDDDKLRDLLWFDAIQYRLTAAVAKSEIYESSWTWKMAQSRPKIHQRPRERQREGEMGHLQLNHFT